MFCTMSLHLAACVCTCAHLGLDIRLRHACYRITLLGILCTATGRDKPHFPPFMSKQVYIYTMGDVCRCAAADHEDAHGNKRQTLP